MFTVFDMLLPEGSQPAQGSKEHYNDLQTFEEPGGNGPQSTQTPTGRGPLERKTESKSLRIIYDTSKNLP